MLVLDEGEEEEEEEDLIGSQGWGLDEEKELG